MPDLIETYARSTGLKIDRPWVKEDFFPLPFARYITLGAGSGQAAKNYDYYGDVVALLNPFLGPLGITVVLLGDKDTPLISGTYDLRAKATINQSYYLVKRALLHLGNDSWATHAAGWSNVPLVALYGSTDAYIHGPHWKSDKTALLSSHRRGARPVFGPEQPKTVNYIDAFEVARQVLDLLAIPHTLTQRTQFIGATYNAPVIEWIPNMAVTPQFNPDLPLAARMDIEFNEQALVATLQTGRKVNIITKRPINSSILAGFRDSIFSFNLELSDCPPEYITQAKKLVKNTVLFSRLKDEAALAALRFRYMDVANIEQVADRTRADFLRGCEEYLNLAPNALDKSTHFDTLEFKTQKYVLSRGKIYLSLAHEKVDLPTTGIVNTAPIIDNDLFFTDLNHLYIYLK